MKPCNLVNGFRCVEELSWPHDRASSIEGEPWKWRQKFLPIP
jgi:hypothetical protein